MLESKLPRKWPTIASAFPEDMGGAPGSQASMSARTISNNATQRCVAIRLKGEGR